MIVHEDIMAVFTAESVMKIVGEPMQSNIDLHKEVLVECAAKIKITNEIITQGKKYRFLIITVGLAKYRKIIRNLCTVWTKPEDPAPFDDSIAATDMMFTKSKQE